MKTPDLDTRIADLRERLRRLYDSGYGFQEPEVLKLSQQIDRLILKKMGKGRGGSRRSELKAGERGSNGTVSNSTAKGDPSTGHIPQNRFALLFRPQAWAV